MNITSVAKKNLSRPDLAQHILHQNYEFHTGQNSSDYEIRSWLKINHRIEEIIFI